MSKLLIHLTHEQLKWNGAISGCFVLGSILSYNFFNFSRKYIYASNVKILVKNIEVMNFLSF